MKYRVIGDRVLVKIEEEEKKSSGGIIIATSNGVEHGELGTIAGMGPKAENLGYNIGDKVAFQRYAGVIPAGDRSYRVMEHDNILVIIEEE